MIRAWTQESLVGASKLNENEILLSIAVPETKSCDSFIAVCRMPPKRLFANMQDFWTSTPASSSSLRNYELPWESPIHICTGKLKPEFRLAKNCTRPAISASVSGSGIGSPEAKLSCLCEGLERHSGIFRGDEPRRVARYSEIAEQAIHPNALTLFSESQYQHREEWNRHEGRHNWVPERFDPERSIDWSPAWSLTQKQVMYLPTAYCYYGYPFDPAHDFCRPDSNGNAAGHDLDSAIVHGFLELVERECASVWWYNQIRQAACGHRQLRIVHGHGDS